MCLVGKERGVIRWFGWLVGWLVDEEKRGLFVCLFVCFFLFRKSKKGQDLGAAAQRDGMSFESNG